MPVSMKEKLECKVVGGELGFPGLTPDMAEKHYAIAKMICWGKLLEDGMMPQKWRKPSKQGTKLSFVTIDESNVQEALDEYTAYVKEINKKFKTTFKVTVRKSSDNTVIRIQLG